MTDAMLPMMPDLLCFSHLRWDFVFQRPQHLLTRFARERRVFYVEEPVHDTDTPRLDIREAEQGVRVVVPHAPDMSAVHELIDRLVDEEELRRYVCWYYTPMAVPFSRHLAPLAVAYDCMDELSLFRGAPAQLVEL